jgi:hypothetical protein
LRLVGDGCGYGALCRDGSRSPGKGFGVGCGNRGECRFGLLVWLSFGDKFSLVVGGVRENSLRRELRMGRELP